MPAVPREVPVLQHPLDHIEGKSTGSGNCKSKHILKECVQIRCKRRFSVPKFIGKYDIKVQALKARYLAAVVLCSSSHPRMVFKFCLSIFEPLLTSFFIR